MAWPRMGLWISSHISLIRVGRRFFGRVVTCMVLRTRLARSFSSSGKVIQHIDASTPPRFGGHERVYGIHCGGQTPQSNRAWHGYLEDPFPLYNSSGFQVPSSNVGHGTRVPTHSTRWPGLPWGVPGRAFQDVLQSN